jgi:hypothetical protein
MEDKNNKEEEKDVCQILDINEFMIFVQHNATSLAFTKLSLNPLVLEHITEIVDGSITEEKLRFYSNRFLFAKLTKELDFNSEDLYVYKSDIGRIITLIANDIVSFALNKMVDKGFMDLCWDGKAKDFIWLEKKK